MKVEMLEEIIKESRKYPETHFGLKVGEGWPAFVTEMLESKELRSEIGGAMLLAMMLPLMGTKEKLAAIPPGHPDPFNAIARDPLFYENPLKFLYYGYKIGRREAELEKLEKLAE